MPSTLDFKNQKRVELIKKVETELMEAKEANL